MSSPSALSGEADELQAVQYEAVREAPTNAIVELYQAGGWWQESQAARENIPQLIRGSLCFLVARAEHRLVGMGRAISDGVSDAYIQDVVVLPEYRGRGIGAEIIRRLTDACAERGIGWIGLVAEPGTQPFYEKLGFAPLVAYQPMLFAGKKK